MKRKSLGYCVSEQDPDGEYEQYLVLDESKGLPPGGVLRFPISGEARYVFPFRPAAFAAIKRTEHYRLAYGKTMMPEAKSCKVHKLETKGD